MITGTVIILGVLLILIACFMYGKPATFGQQFSANPVTRYLYNGWNGT